MVECNLGRGLSETDAGAFPDFPRRVKKPNVACVSALTGVIPVDGFSTTTSQALVPVRLTPSSTREMNPKKVQ